MPGLLAVLAITALTACSRAPQNKEAVRQAVIEHVSKNAGLDMSQMDVDVTAVSFKDKDANATVSFRPKGSGDPGMRMNYTLQAKGNRWEVVKRTDSSTNPHGTAAPPGALPPGHPPVESSGPAR
jgi:hypothetical protein